MLSLLIKQLYIKAVIPESINVFDWILDLIRDDKKEQVSMIQYWTGIVESCNCLRELLQYIPAQILVLGNIFQPLLDILPCYNN